MSLEAILNHILQGAEQERLKIIQEAESQADQIIQQAQNEAVELYQRILEEGKKLFSAQKQKLIVNARLEGKKIELSAKQELIAEVFNQLKSNLKPAKKEQVSLEKVKEVTEDASFYLAKLRQDYESEAAKILFA